MLACFKARKDRKAKEMRNGRMLLETSIALNDGKVNPIRCFSVKDLKQATNNYNTGQVIWDDGFYKLYRGFLQDRPIILKKGLSIGLVEYHIREIVIASQMSSHNYVLKLLGCCLETEIPLLVFESAENGTLHDHIYNLYDAAGFTPLPWKIRLRIAVGIANIIAYLHTAFPKPFIHMDVKAANIFLDQDYLPKLTDFYLSTAIPEGESHVEHGVPVEYATEETRGFLAPELFLKNTINEKVDIYSFGVLLLSLLTGKMPHDPFPSASPDNNFSLVYGLKAYMTTQNFNCEAFVDPVILQDGGPWPGKDQQLQKFALLALQCTCDLEDDRPEISDVAKQLMKIYQSAISAC